MSYLFGNPKDRFSRDEAHFFSFAVLEDNILKPLRKLFFMSSVFFKVSTVMILSFRTDMPGQTVQTRIRLFLEEQSDQGLHCLPFRLHRLDSLLYGRAT